MVVYCADFCSAFSIFVFIIVRLLFSTASVNQDHSICIYFYVWKHLDESTGETDWREQFFEVSYKKVF